METLRWIKILFIVSGNNLRPIAHAPFQRCLYKIYANFGKLVLHSIFVVQVLDIVFNVTNLDEFTENFAITSMLFTVLLKRKMICTRRANILTLIEMLDKNSFLPVNRQETKIRMKFDKIIDWSVKMYTILISVFINGLFLVSLIVDFEERKLVSRIWLPYDYSSVNLYLLSSIYEFVTGAFASFVTLSCECLYAGLALHICCQLEILEHRIKTIRGKDNYAVNHCASHHHRIYEYAEMVNDEFRKIVSVQFFFSMAVLCLNLYRITYAGNLTRFVEAVMFAVCVFLQIFYYCLYGDVVKSKSTEFSSEIFDSNWPSWNERSKKILLMIIRRSRIPIEFTSMHVVSLSLESFMSLLKTSYSAFNLLQTSR